MQRIFKISKRHLQKLALVEQKKSGTCVNYGNVNTCQMYLLLHICQIEYILKYSKCKFIVELYWIIKNMNYLLFYCKYTLNFSLLVVMYFIFLLYNFLPIHFFQYRKDIWVIHEAWESGVYEWPISMPNITRQYQRRI